jgi:hypothetical protein
MEGTRGLAVQPRLKFFMKPLFAISLMQFPLADQWDRPVQWDKFNEVPKVLILSGRNSGTHGRDWGAYITEKFNPGFVPQATHLQEVSLLEKVKVIAVAALPDVPGMFKYLFRSGFRKESNSMGLALDFSSTLSKQFSFEEKQENPKIVLISPKGEKLGEFEGKVSDEKLVAEVNSAVSKLLK